MDKSADNHRKIADWLDQQFTIPGTNIRFGIDPIIGLVPGAGDWLAGVVSLYFMVLAVQNDAKRAVLLRMFLNILLDVLIGSIPVLGEIFDVYWKANVRNAELLDKLQQDAQKTKTQSRWFNWILLIIFAAIIVGLLILVGWLVVEIFEWLF